jgi:nucleotide-binding universal stress UspA family protein
MFHKILVCLDCSKFSERALTYATIEANKFSSKLILLHVCTKNFVSFPVPISGQFIPIPVESILEDFSQRCIKAKAYLEQLALILKREGLIVEVVVLEGFLCDLPDIIIKYAEENYVDLIAMTTHGRKGLKRIFWGSVADSVTGKSTIPTLIVKSSDEFLDTEERQNILQEDPETLIGLSLQ